MTCPRCHTEFESMRNICPECGVRLLRNVSGVIKTSAVLISVGKKCGFYRSVQEVPEPLRTQLITTTAGQNSGTIVIADRAGKEQLTRVMARQDENPEGNSEGDSEDYGSAQETVAEPIAETSPADNIGYRLYGVSWVAWAGLVAVLSAAAIVSTLFGMRW